MREAALLTGVEGTVPVRVLLGPVHRQVVFIYGVAYGSKWEITDLSRGQGLGLGLGWGLTRQHSPRVKHRVLKP